MSDALVVLITAPSREVGEMIAETLVGEQLAACVNLLGPVRSIYRWQGAITRDDEILLIAKTTRDRYPALEARVQAVHPYDTPEIIALPIEMGSAAYLAWLTGETGKA
ncbi:MAG: divalent-cation tolerance protein CutA [Candidatus Binatia bacterium]